MKVFFSVAVLLGFVGTLAGARVLPVGTHARLPSKTTVVANGGRAEQLVIRLPADEIAATDAPIGGLRGAQGRSRMELPAQLAAAPLLVEHFKVRDSGGNVIGIAARHWTVTADGPTTSWAILMPSRGSLALTSPGEAPGTLEAALKDAGYSQGAAWTGEAHWSLGGGGTGAVAEASGEFAGLTGSYTEDWTITGVDESGELRGTIELSTVTKQTP
jgi:hypothetical protein